MSVPGKCIFCEAIGGLSKEHIWPVWSHDYLPRRGPSHTSSHFLSRSGITGLSRSRTAQGDLRHKTMRVVCKRCNSGWMGSLEARVKPLLVPLVRGTPLPLERADMERLSAWVVAKCMVAGQSSKPDAASTQLERTHLMLTQTAPVGWGVWIGHQIGASWYTGLTRCAVCIGKARRGLEPVPPDPALTKNTESFTLGFGRAVIHAIYTRVPDLATGLPAGIAKRFIPILPAPAAALWPPAITPDWAIDSLSLALSEFSNSLRWHSGGK